MNVKPVRTARTAYVGGKWNRAPVAELTEPRQTSRANRERRLELNDLAGFT